MIHWGRFAVVILVVALVAGFLGAVVGAMRLDTATQTAFAVLAGITPAVMIVSGTRDWWLR